MRLLVTNDDGVGAPGIAALAAALLDAGHEVVVAAPADDRSGASAAIGGMHLDETIEVQPVEPEGLEGATCYSVVASPALVVIVACLGGFGPAPDLVVSGINAGANTGRAVLHSGTVGAALTAANFGRSGLAVSQALGRPFRWPTATALAVPALDWLAAQPAPQVVNLNAPDLALEEVRGVRDAGLAPFGTVRAAVVEAKGGLQMELTGDGEGVSGDDVTGDDVPSDDVPSDSDTGLLRAGYATLTCLTGLGAVARPDAVAAVEQRFPVRTG
ncbi:MAG: 5'/3'-nucleotidase SurE [Actinomycetota bacterium]|jgi:5'-nucleotidase|nr:5'/3'-nucleotidase SurE [Actinomycetota bacterium]